MVRTDSATTEAARVFQQVGFVAMGCECNLTVVAEPGESPAGVELLSRRAVARVQDLDAKWSRFRADSEISELNRSTGRPVHVSSDTVALVRALVEAWRATAGAFDPTLLPLLLAGGYARSRRNPELVTALPAHVVAPGRPGDVVVFEETGDVVLPFGTTLDSGGLGKGLAADWVAQQVMDGGAIGVLVDIGGDLRVMGRPPRGDAWRITLAADQSVVVLRDGGVATSCRLTRQQLGSGTAQRVPRLRHDLINPYLADASRNSVTTVSVVAGTAAWAEAMTKLPFVLGRTAGLSALNQRAVAASTWTDGVDDLPHCTSTWWNYLEVAQ
ncbi:MAG: FAD:protein FMN transferase [Candidatus Nanopelagicales bacterium]|nr:FAD:protein FMN transferase [Candidatus Nanopelagicales bacterium]